MLKIRLSMGGVRKRPVYKIVVADSRFPRDGRFIEKVGFFNPLLPKTKKERVNLQVERIKHWISKGAKPTLRVSRILGEAEVFPMPPKGNNPLKAIPKKDRKKDKSESEKPAVEVAKTEPKKEESKKEAPKAAKPKAESKKEETKKDTVPKTKKERVNLEVERIKHWISKGAKPTLRVSRILGEAEVYPMPPKGNNPLKAIPKKDRKKDKSEGEKPIAEGVKAEPKKEEPKKEAPKAATPKAEPKKEEPKKE